ncbi:hypothetical protein AB0G74_15840 [Streptomyces sp. NPDC020875]|uniref:hypothetical protein n=1 Tax=Streptomyces sp. NPDC020875 TaxID=3154898 RepID=UPI0033FF3C31
MSASTSAPVRDGRGPAIPEAGSREEGAPGAARVTAAGAEWLASAGSAARAPWERRPGHGAVLPCGTLFDVVSAPAVFGRLLLDRVWEEGPGSGPVVAYRGRLLVFAAPGTAARLPALLSWEEWGSFVPPLMYHGTGDAVTVPPDDGRGPEPDGAAGVTAPRWLVAPGSRYPWLPGPEVLLWACVRAARAAGAAPTGFTEGSGGPIFPRPDRGAKVYDVSRRR